MVVFALLLVSMTAVSIGLLAYRQARHALETAARARLEIVARDIAEHLHGELEDRAADITLWSRLEVMLALTYRDVDKALAEFLRQTLTGQRVYRAIVCLGQDGTLVASAGDVRDVKLDDEVEGTRVIVVPASPQDERTHGLLQLETPVLNPLQQGQRIGTLVAVLDPTRVIDALSLVPPGAGPIEVTLRSRRGPVLVRAEAAADGSTTSMARGRGRVLVAGARVARLSNAVGPDLRVAVFEPERVALAGVVVLRQALLRLSVLVLGLGAALGGLAAWRISHPIRRLTATVQEITRRGRPEEIEPLPEGGGEVGMLAASFRAMMQSLAGAQRETLAQSRLALLGEVAASLAHDVRTPLSVLKTSAHLLSKDDLAATERRDLADMVVAEVDRLNAVVTSLVDLARPKPARYEVVLLRPLIERATALFGPVASKAGVKVETVTEADDVTVCGNGDQLYQVLLNLIHNALQAMNGPGALQVRCRAEPPWVEVEVRDTGPGFGEDALARAFSPFFTTKADGTGLGMAIVKRVVEEHGGTVGVRNSPGSGACVWFKLPIVGSE